MKKLPIGKQNITDILSNKMLYVDKTRQVYELITEGSLYFLSRPRRFGKSLLISTLEAVFKGKRSLFEGLYIAEQVEYDWEEYPVLRFSFAKMGYNVRALETALLYLLAAAAKDFDVILPDTTLSFQLESLVLQIAKKSKPVVILIDEYDKPIVDFITDIEQATINLGVLKDFFSPLKDLEASGHLHFLFITGVSKFSKVSLFSDLNNLTDLSVSPIAHDLTGITQQELLDNFPDYIKQAALAFEMPIDTLLEHVRLWYNGRVFSL